MALTSLVGHPTFESFDADIRHYEATLLDLRVRRNHLASISRLFPELLVEIFRLCVASAAISLECPFGATSGRAKSHDNGWTNLFGVESSEPVVHPFSAPCRMAILLSHVCRRWRAIARDDAELWTHLDLRSEMWTWRGLARSKAAPLVVRASLVDEAWPTKASSQLPLIHLALKQLSRIKVLSLDIGPAQFNHVAQSLTRAAPLLEAFTLENSSALQASNPWDGGIRPDIVYTVIPDNLFDGVVPPRLTRLSITALANLTWSSHLFTGAGVPVLIHLELVKMPSLQTSPFQSFLTALRSMPRLRCLILTKCMPVVGPTDRSAAASLPELARLSIHDTLSACSRLFNHVSDVPPSVEMTITAEDADTISDRSSRWNDVQTTLRGLASGCKDIRTLLLGGFVRGHRSRLIVRCWSTVEKTVSEELWDDGQTYSKIRLVLDLRQALPLSDALYLLAGLLPLQGVTSFMLTCIDHNEFEVEGWPAASDDMKSATILRVNAHMFAILVRIRLDSPHPDNLLPALRELTLAHILFTDRIFDKLRRFIVARPPGCHLQVVRLVQSPIRRTHVDELRRLVGTVHVENDNISDSSVPAMMQGVPNEDNIVSEEERLGILADLPPVAVTGERGHGFVEAADPFMGESDDI